MKVAIVDDDQNIARRQADCTASAAHRDRGIHQPSCRSRRANRSPSKSVSGSTWLAVWLS